MPPEGSSTASSAMPEGESSLIVENNLRNSKKEKEIDPRLLNIHSEYFPPLEIVWRNVGLFIYLHAAALVGLYFVVTGQVQWRTMIWAILWHLCGAFGITAGSHRLWAHKSYKAKLPLRIILAFMQTVSFQVS
jgi:fatty-acid desaturase